MYIDPYFWNSILIIDTFKKCEEKKMLLDVICSNDIKKL